MKALFATVLALCIFAANAQVYNMGSTPAITTCSGIFYDDGGHANPYSRGQNSVTTFYSNSDSAIYFRVEYMVINALDSLFFFDGTDTLAPLIAAYSGLANISEPHLITSSNSSNCITVLFKAPADPVFPNAQGNMGWKMHVGCLSGNTPPVGCAAASHFCANTSYPILSGQPPQLGPDYGCLMTQQSPHWFYLQINNPGALHLDLANSAQVDVDFVCWGPFADTDFCGKLVSNKLVDCSYSSSATERVDINNAQNGDYYVVCATNYGSNLTNLSVTINAMSNATLSCNADTVTVIDTSTCVINSANAVATGCAEDGYYSVNGYILLTDAPASGTLTVQSSQGQQSVYNAPFADSISYDIQGFNLADDSVYLAYYFSDDAACNTITMISDVRADIALEATAGPYIVDSAGSGWINISANGSAGPYSYLWNTGDTTAAISDLLPATYYVTVTNARGCSVTDSAEVEFEGLELMLMLNVIPASSATAMDGSITAVVTGGIPPYSFLWSNQEETATISQLSPGVYTLTVSDAAGFQKTGDTDVTFSVGISDAKGGFTFSVMPNPATTQLRFEFTNGTQGEGYILGLDGKLFETFNVANTVETVNIAKLPVGAYIVQIKDKNTNASSFSRIVKN